MLTTIRKIARSWVSLILIGLLVVAFAVWGISDIFRPTNLNAAATGEGFEIADREFDRAFETAIRAAENQSGQPLSRIDAREQGLGQQALERLIAQRALSRVAERMGVATSDASVAEQIRNDQMFKDPITGAFNADTYRRTLAENQLSERDFENDLRAGITRRKLGGAALAGVYAPSSFANFAVRFESERRTASIAEVPPTRAGAIPEPTDKDLDTLYKSLSAQLATPEFRKLTLFAARTADFEARVEVSDARLKELYTFQMSRPENSEKRSFVQVTAKDEKGAAEAARRLAAGEDPAAIATAVGGQVNPFESVTRPAVPDSAVAEAAFKLAAGASSGAIKSALAWSAVRVSAVTPARSFEEMKTELRAGVAREEAQDLQNKAIEAFDDAVAGGQPPEAAAKAAGLNIAVIDQTDAQGRTDEGQPIPEIAEAKDLLTAAFAATQDELTDFVAFGQGDYARIRVDAVTPPGVRPLASVRPQLVQLWKNQNLGEKLRAIAQLVEKDVKAGKSFKEAATAQKLRVVSDQETVGRRQAMQGPAAAFGQALFAAKEGDVIIESLQGAPVLLVGQLHKIERDDPKTNPAAVAQMRQLMDQLLQQDTVQAFQTGAVEAAKVRRNQPVIDRVLGVTPTDAEAPAK